ncbi:hemolysin type calcium-binding protein [Loktanella sp. PT4BL]|jgi:Ca2+-binding RTX toxin-like protein|uniref:M10 family metallopeptidase n=1 Tax=Loktanella sp. PT4BL TaxID=2135611 RepID=UPI000D75EB01|nr:M10 family metallopeptidase [Loktanella sp. PT4BL]PXW72319.1 hemolysin type calcium-binding protein [Loktanella sp. PT4BL]
MADIPNNASTSATLTIGGSLTSAIDSNGDRDWVRIDLGPGHYAAINLTGIGLNDPILRVYDADGNLVAINDDVSEGFDIDSRVTIGSAEGGTFYIEAGAFDDSGTGSYQLTATETTPVDPLDSGLARGDDVITVYFVEDGNRANFDVSRLGSSEVVSDGWTQSERDAVMAALGVISNYVDLRFVLSTESNADFQMVLDDNELGSPGLLGYFYLPGNANYTGASMGVFNANGFGWSDGLTAGGLGFSTVIHEALHGLGLDHPHDGDIVLAGLGDQRAGNFPFGIYGDFELNQTVYTIMSYNGGWNGASPTTNSYGDAASPMALDIAMLQELYGANTTHNNGNNTYELASANAVGTGWVAIWDTGGVDTITYSGTRDTVIDLRPATLEYEVGGGGFISNASGIQGGFTIANGVVIENATSGSGNDILVGNDADNVLTGNGGNDLLIGGHGQDTLNGGAGNDDISGGTGSDVIDAGANNDAVDGNSGNDTISTSGGTNTIYGSSGNDQITGGTGADTVYAGSGNDQITGGGGNDALFGGRGNDTIQGGGGADDITGGLGQDTMTGGSGADVFIFNAISDSWDNNRDTITDFDTEADLIDLSMIDANLSLGGDQAFTFNSGGAPTNAAGEIWATMSGSDTIIFVDQDGDGIADMGITLEETTGVTAGDFIL